jgi:hypothetical protein
MVPPLVAPVPGVSAVQSLLRLEETVEGVEERGYTFVPITELK